MGGERGKTRNERHAAWERSARMQNDRHAAWERVFCQHGPARPIQKSSPKTSKTVYFRMFWMFFGTPLEHPILRTKKMDQPKWTPKSAHSDCAKYLFFQHIWKILFFVADFRCTNLFPKVQKYIGFIDVLDALTGCTNDHPSEQEKNKRSKNERHCSESAPAPKKTSATLHGSVPAQNGSPQKGAKKTSQTV